MDYLPTLQMIISEISNIYELNFEYAEVGIE
jgi:hypothetical protein